MVKLKYLKLLNRNYLINFNILFFLNLKHVSWIKSIKENELLFIDIEVYSFIKPW